MVGFEADAVRARSFVGDLGVRTCERPRPDRRGRAGVRTWLVALFAAVLLAASSGAFLLAAELDDPEGGLEARISYTVHAPIMIAGNAGFTPASGVTGGSGTSLNPYVIKD